MISDNMNEIGDRPFYYADIYVNVSEDGGKSFTQLMSAYGIDNEIYPDHHAQQIQSKNGDFVIDGAMAA